MLPSAEDVGGHDDDRRHRATNLPYRNIGIPYPRAVKETPDGILCIDMSNPNEPKVRRLEIGQNTNNLTIVPTPISDALDLSAHAFDYAVAFRWGDYEIVCCQEYINGMANAYNWVMYVRNVFSARGTSSTTAHRASTSTTARLSRAMPYQQRLSPSSPASTTTRAQLRTIGRTGSSTLAPTTSSARTSCG